MTLLQNLMRNTSRCICHWLAVCHPLAFQPFGFKLDCQFCRTDWTGELVWTNVLPTSACRRQGTEGQRFVKPPGPFEAAQAVPKVF